MIPAEVQRCRRRATARSLKCWSSKSKLFSIIAVRTKGYTQDFSGMVLQFVFYLYDDTTVHCVMLRMVCAFLSSSLFMYCCALRMCVYKHEKQCLTLVRIHVLINEANITVFKHSLH